MVLVGGFFWLRWWPGHIAYRDVSPGVRVDFAGGHGHLVVAEGWEGDATTYLPIPSWTGIGQGGIVCLRDQVVLKGPEGQSLTVFSYYEDDRWPMFLADTRAADLVLDSQGTVFEGTGSEVFSDPLDPGHVVAYLPWEDGVSATVFVFEGPADLPTPQESLAAIASALQLKVSE